MAGILARAAGLGGHSIINMVAGNAGTCDVACIDLTVQGAQNDTMITSLFGGAIIAAPAGTTAPPEYAIRWAILSGQDVSAALLAAATAVGASAAGAPLGGSGGEFLVGGGASFPPLLPAGISSRVMAEGFLYAQMAQVLGFWPEDADDPGALIIRGGATGQLVLFGAVTPGVFSTAQWSAMISVNGGPVIKRNTRLNDGLPYQEYAERS
jgi:hypothetical protein